MKKKVTVYISLVYISLVVMILATSCLTTKSVEGPEGVIEYKGELEMPVEAPVEEPVITEEPVTTEELITSEEVVPSEEPVPISEEPVTIEAETPVFTEMTKEEKEALLEKSPDAEDVNYVYKPEADSDTARIGSVDIPKWFAYLCFGVIIATLIAMCYIANQNKKKMYYYGRRD